MMLNVELVEGKYRAVKFNKPKYDNHGGITCGLPFQMLGNIFQHESKWGVEKGGFSHGVLIKKMRF